MLVNKNPRTIGMYLKLGLMGLTVTILGLMLIGGIIGAIGFPASAANDPWGNTPVNWTGFFISVGCMIPGLTVGSAYAIGKDKKWF